MSDGLIFLAGIGLSGLMLFVIYQTIDEKDNPLLKMVLIVTMLCLMLLIPKTFTDELRQCESVVANSTVSGSVTSYEYTSYCFTESTSTDSAFMKIIFWLYRGIILYLIIYLFWQAVGALLSMRGVSK